MVHTAPLRVMVVDDTAVYRKIVGTVVADLPNVELAGTAPNGKIAISKLEVLKPDLLTLDIEMPEINGLEVLAHIKANRLNIGAVMLSTLTQQGGEMTMKAMELGAFDFIPKPQTGTMDENIKLIKAGLEPMIKAFSDRRVIRSLLLKSGGEHKKSSVVTDQVKRLSTFAGKRREKSEIVAIGISTGGPNALAAMMPQLPENLGVPIVIVQHMPPVFTQSLADSLNNKCAVYVKEAQDGEPIQPNTAFIAPGGKQMKVAAGADGRQRIIKITNDPPENSCKPSADYLFRSVAHLYVGRATGVIMTGMGSDGAKGLAFMKKNGSTVIAQSEKTCVVFGMPKEAISDGVVDIVSPLNEIAREICKTVRST